MPDRITRREYYWENVCGGDPFGRNRDRESPLPSR